MANVEKIRHVQNQPFVNKLKELMDEKFAFSSSDRIIKVIEIGCGPGDFALIFKDTFKDRVQITAIDPGEKDINLAKEKSIGNDVDFQQSDIFKFKTDIRFDLVLFTKSLHHCIPVDQAVKNAYNLLSEDGIFFAEEVYIDKMHGKDLSWFFDRMDLLRSAGRMRDTKEIIEKHAFSKSMMTKLLDTSLPISERWFRPHIHGEEGHSHDHNHGNHGHGNHEYGHEHPHDQQDDIVGSSAVIAAIKAQFDQEKLTFVEVPYFYQFLTLCGLKDDDLNCAVLQELYIQEVNAINSHAIKPLGINIIGHK